LFLKLILFDEVQSGADELFLKAFLNFKQTLHFFTFVSGNK